MTLTLTTIRMSTAYKQITTGYTSIVHTLNSTLTRTSNHKQQSSHTGGSFTSQSTHTNTVTIVVTPSNPTCQHTQYSTSSRRLNAPFPVANWLGLACLAILFRLQSEGGLPHRGTGNTLSIASRKAGLPLRGTSFLTFSSHTQCGNHFPIT